VFFLTIFQLLLALAAVYTSWLDFPLSASINAYQVGWIWQGYFPTSLGLAFQLLILFGCAFLLYRQFFIALILLSMALAQVLFMPWHILLTHPDWLVSYLIESQERQQLYYFTREYFVPNIISEPTYISTTKSETLLDQISIVFRMLSIGWYISLLANSAILIVLLKHWKHSLQLVVMLTLIISFGFLPVITSTFTQLQAAQAQHQGNQHLANNEANEALQEYSLALKLNPALRYSPYFLLKAADTYAIVTHGLHPSTNISKARIIIEQNNLFNSYTATAISYRQARALLQKADDNYFPVTALDKALFNFSPRLINQLWTSEGLAEYQRGHLHKAMQAFQQVTTTKDQLVARFFLATLYIRLNTPQLALELLHPYLIQISHPSVKADIYCTIGDAYTRAKDWSKARAAYLSCTKWDNTKNYRVTRALSGF